MADDLKNLENTQITVSFLNNKIEELELPLSLHEFRKKIKSIFQIEDKLDEIFIIYSIIDINEEKQKKERIIEIKRNEDYISLLKKIKSNEVKDDIIFIETERVPDEISRETPENFEEEIECMIRTQLKAAGERIKKGLSGKSELIPSSNFTNKMCCKCQKHIIGNVYRSVTDLEQKIYCEKCSYLPNCPMFVIH